MATGPPFTEFSPHLSPASSHSAAVGDSLPLFLRFNSFWISFTATKVILASLRINLDNPLAKEVMTSYESMGDTLAFQYGGSAAHNKPCWEITSTTTFEIYLPTLLPVSTDLFLECLLFQVFSNPLIYLSYYILMQVGNPLMELNMISIQEQSSYGYIYRLISNSAFKS
ncbi:phosphoinositide phosphatase SAC2 [Trifolium repens]|nr:phosphoinositide phosphatase SAC2 [Trifolium repens]